MATPIAADPVAPAGLSAVPDKNGVETIAAAIERFKRGGEDSIYPGYRELVTTMIDNGIKSDFENDSYLDALFLTHLMFSRAQNSIKLFTGNNGDEFLKVLNRPFENALERIKKAGGSVKIILLSAALPNWLGDLKAKYPETLDVVLAKALQPVKHFILCDSKMARLEEPHGELTPTTPATTIKAKVYFNDTAKCKDLEGVFQAMWSILRPKPGS